MRTNVDSPTRFQIEDFLSESALLDSFEDPLSPDFTRKAGLQQYSYSNVTNVGHCMLFNKSFVILVFSTSYDCGKIFELNFKMYRKYMISKNDGKKHEASHKM